MQSQFIQNLSPHVEFADPRRVEIEHRSRDQQRVRRARERGRNGSTAGQAYPRHPEQRCAAPAENQGLPP